MTTWTIAREVSFQHHPKVDSVIPQYAWLDITASPNPESGEIITELLDSTDEAERWFPDIVAGFKEYEMVRSREGRPIGAVWVLITKVYSHPIATNSEHVKWVAKSAIRKLFEEHGQVPVG